MINTRSSFLLALCTPLIALMPLSSAAAGCALDRVSQYDSQLNQAISAHDVAASSRYYADGFVLTTSRGSRKTKADMLSEIGNTSVQLDINQTRDIQVFGDQQTAVLIAVLHQKGRIGEQAFDAEVLVTDTWVCADDGHWLLLAGHASRRS